MMSVMNGRILKLPPSLKTRQHQGQQLWKNAARRCGVSSYPCRSDYTQLAHALVRGSSSQEDEDVHVLSVCMGSNPCLSL